MLGISLDCEGIGVMIACVHGIREPARLPSLDTSTAVLGIGIVTVVLMGSLGMTDRHQRVFHRNLKSMMDVLRCLQRVYVGNEQVIDNRIQLTLTGVLCTPVTMYLKLSQTLAYNSR